jgi:hypothetical protein
MKLSYTLEQAADETSLSADTLKKAIRKGDLKSKRSSRDENGDGVGKYLILGRDLQAYLDQLADA